MNEYDFAAQADMNILQIICREEIQIFGTEKKSQDEPIDIIYIRNQRLRKSLM